MATKIELPAAMVADLEEIGESVSEVIRDIEAGREPCVSHTPNGRDIRCTAKGFIVQPRNDNYWITVPTIDAAMDAFENPAKYRQ